MSLNYLKFIKKSSVHFLYKDLLGLNRKRYNFEYILYEGRERGVVGGGPEILLQEVTKKGCNEKKISKKILLKYLLNNSRVKMSLVSDEYCQEVNLMNGGGQDEFDQNGENQGNEREEDFARALFKMDEGKHTHFFLNNPPLNKRNFLNFSPFSISGIYFPHFFIKY